MFPLFWVGTAALGKDSTGVPPVRTPKDRLRLAATAASFGLLPLPFRAESDILNSKH